MPKNSAWSFIVLLCLSSCSRAPVYDFNPGEDFTYLTIEAKRLPARGWLPSNRMSLTLERCQGGHIGMVDLSSEKAKRIKVSTQKPFYGLFYVMHNELGGRSEEGSQYLFFRPREDRDYKLVYVEQEERFTLELYSAEKGGDFTQQERLLLGSRYIPLCPST